jgi:hypothetical protein
MQIAHNIIAKGRSTSDCPYVSEAFFVLFLQRSAERACQVS